MHFQDSLLLNVGRKYCRMLLRSILQYFRPTLSYHLSFRPFILSIFEWSLKTGLTVYWTKTKVPISSVTTVQLICAFLCVCICKKLVFSWCISYDIGHVLMPGVIFAGIERRQNPRLQWLQGVQDYLWKCGLPDVTEAGLERGGGAWIWGTGDHSSSEQVGGISGIL